MTRVGEAAAKGSVAVAQQPIAAGALAGVALGGTGICE